MFDMADKQKQKNIKLLLQDLKQASKLIDSVVRRSRLIETNFNGSDFILKSAKTLGCMHELAFDIFDLEPTLTSDFLKPSLDPVNLDKSLERLLSNNSAIKKSTIIEFKSYMNYKVVAKFKKAIELELEYDFAKEWWNSQEKPFIPIIKIYKELKHDRLFVRFHAAKLLEEKFKIEIWNKDNNDVEFNQIDKILSKLFE